MEAIHVFRFGGEVRDQWRRIGEEASRSVAAAATVVAAAAAAIRFSPAFTTPGKQ